MSDMRKKSGLLGVLLLGAAAACDLSVSNPGPMQDEFLSDPGAHPAVVVGAEVALIQGLNMVTFFGSEAAKEYTQGGRIHPIKLPPNPGQLDTDEQLPDNAWNDAHQARWVAEAAVDRLRENMSDFDKSVLAARALLAAGYANRLLGENMCEAVIDGSAVQPRMRHLERAQAHFTEALAVATAAGNTNLANAALAGRASVRLWLGDNTGAVADASAVPLGFVHQAQFSPGTPNTRNNWVWYISSNTPYRAHSVVGTFYENYYRETGDPRTSWGQNPKVPTAEFTTVPWLFQTKYTGETSPMNLSSGREMVLIRAEVALRQGNWQEALQLINSLRQGLVSNHDRTPLPLATASNATEAWTALKRERGIELWLESRRLGDLWRWVEAKTPGDMEDVSDRIRLCFPVSLSELRTNPNIPLTHKSPTNPLFKGT